MDIKIPLAYPIGSTVYLLEGGDIIKDTIKEVLVSEFTLSKANPTPPKPRYRLSTKTGVHYEVQLFSSPDEIVERVAEMARKYQDEIAEAV